MNKLKKGRNRIEKKILKIFVLFIFVTCIKMKKIVN